MRVRTNWQTIHVDRIIASLTDLSQYLPSAEAETIASIHCTEGWPGWVVRMNTGMVDPPTFCGARLAGDNIKSPAAHWRSTVQLFLRRNPSATSEYNTHRRRSGDADACSENCVALFRRPTSAAPNSSLSATAYAPVAGGHSGKLATWLWQRLLDRPPGLSYASSAVSSQRSCAADFQLASLRPCLRRTHQPSLAACSWAHQVKSCRPGVQGLLSYLGPFTYVADRPSRRGLRSSCSDCLVQPSVHHSTVGSRAFSVAGPRVWNCLPLEVTSAQSLATFRTRLKTFLLTESYESYPDIRLIWHFVSIHCLLST